MNFTDAELIAIARESQKQADGSVLIYDDAGDLYATVYQAEGQVPVRIERAADYMTAGQVADFELAGSLHDGISTVVSDRGTEITVIRPDSLGAFLAALNERETCTSCDTVPENGQLVPWSDQRLCWSCTDGQLDLLARAVMAETPATIGQPAWGLASRLTAAETADAVDYAIFGDGETEPDWADGGPDYLSEGLAEDATREARA